jgi:hypothetical protein
MKDLESLAHEAEQCKEFAESEDAMRILGS